MCACTCIWTYIMQPLKALDADKTFGNNIRLYVILSCGPRLGSLLPAPLILRPTPWSTLPLHPSIILVVAIHSPTPYWHKGQPEKTQPLQPTMDRNTQTRTETQNEDGVKQTRIQSHYVKIMKCVDYATIIYRPRVYVYQRAYTIYGIFQHF